MSHAQVGRLERGAIGNPSLGQLVRLATVVGLDLTLRAYPSSDAIRDAGHVRLLERLRVQVHPSLVWRTEVPLPGRGDLRAWDAVITGKGWSLPVEAETRITDGQAMQRRLATKMRDAGVDHALLLVADTRANRAALISMGGGIAAAFPLPAREMHAALSEGKDPGGAAILVM